MRLNCYEPSNDVILREAKNLVTSGPPGAGKTGCFALLIMTASRTRWVLAGLSVLAVSARCVDAVECLFRLSLLKGRGQSEGLFSSSHYGGHLSPQSSPLAQRERQTKAHARRVEDRNSFMASSRGSAAHFDQSAFCR